MIKFKKLFENTDKWDANICELKHYINFELSRISSGKLSKEEIEEARENIKQHRENIQSYREQSKRKTQGS
jgi:hypothetical protein